jgi:hypothetical protein
VIIMSRIAIALLDGRVSEGIAADRLILQAGCTPEGARGHVAAWREPLINFTAPRRAGHHARRGRLSG